MIRLGSIARDRITGFQGMVVGRVLWLHQVDRYEVKPTDLKDGVPLDAHQFDEPALEVLGHSGFEPLPLARPQTPVCLGDLVRDRVTQFSGIAIARTEYIGGCSRVHVQPTTLGNDGEPGKLQSFDETVVEVVAVADASPERDATRAVKTGGPRPTFSR